MRVQASFVAMSVAAFCFISGQAEAQWANYDGYQVQPAYPDRGYNPYPPFPDEDPYAPPRASRSSAFALRARPG